jgi:hypothetical protein
MRSNPIIPILIAALILVGAVMFVRFGMPKVTTTSRVAQPSPTVPATPTPATPEAPKGEP